MAGAFDTVYNALICAIDILGKNTRYLVKNFLKISVFLIIAQLLLVLSVVGVDVLGRNIGASGNFVIMFALLLIVLAISILWSIAHLTISTTAYCLIDEKLQGREISILSKAKEILHAMARYVLIWWAIIAIAFAILFALMILTSTSEIMMLIAPLLMLILVVVFIGVIFLTQFSIPELILKKTTVKDSLRNSFDLIRKNFWAVVLFDITLVAFVFIILLIISILEKSAAALFPLATTDVMWVFAGLVLSLIFSLLQTLTLSSLWALLNYFFWKGISANVAVTEAVVKPTSKPRKKK